MNINNEVLQKLIKGSRNIDRMREEIDLVVEGLVGLVKKCNQTFPQEELVIGNRKWVIENMSGDTTITCLAALGNHWITIYSNHEIHGSTPPLGSVKKVYGDLPQVVSLIEFRVSGLDKHLQYLLNAAEVFE